MRHRSAWRGIAASLVAVWISGAVSVAAATPSWHAVPSANPPAPASVRLGSVACATATTCFATGGGLVLRSTGAVWGLTSLPRPTGSVGLTIAGIDCPTATSCTAVGRYASSDGGGSVVETWDGTAWTLQARPDAGGSHRSLVAVSCWSASQCVAVGFDYVDSGASTSLIQRWDGGSWRTEQLPTAPLGSSRELTDVACPGPTACLVVGSISGDPNSEVVRQLAYRLDGTTWTNTSTPALGDRDYLTGVACASETRCFAVGVQAYPSLGFVERWDGTAWSPVSLPPSGSAESSLRAVNCLPGAGCTAVGGAWTSGESARTLVYAEHGTTWDATRGDPAIGGVLEGVDCASSASCVAVGSWRLALIERWDGSTWRVSSGMLGVSQSALDAVDCPGASTCFAVGLTSTLAGTRSLVERWDGSAWAKQTSPNAPGGWDTSLVAVSCPGVDRCFAVGSGRGGTEPHHVPVILSWDGVAWTSIAVPVLPRTVDEELRDISCTSMTDCIAVARIERDGFLRNAFTRWNGTSWSVTQAPASSDISDVGLLNGVTCANATTCFAVGWHESLSGQKLLIERWNGSSWAIVAAPAVPDSTNPELLDISCGSASSCVAVGSSSDPLFDGARVITVRWNGGPWTLTSAPTPASGTTEAAASVSCATPTVCHLVGRVRSGNGSRMLAERWDGTAWSRVGVQSRPYFRDLAAGVSCRTGLPCIAVGSSTRPESSFTLVEQLT